MKNKFSIFICAISLVFMTTGCASIKDLKLSDVHKSNTITLARTETAPLMRPSVGSNAALFTGVMFGAIGGGIGGGIATTVEKSNGEKLAKQYNLPDFGELLMQNLNERKDSELIGFSNLEIIGQPITKKEIDGITIIIDNSMLRVANKIGLYTSTALKVVDENREGIGYILHSYSSKKHKRGFKVKDLEGDEGVALQEEMKNAAEDTISSFIHYLNTGKKMDKAESKQ
jgi:hypothetical protein